MKILVLNWRDITHPWAGGAERHIHDLSKYWVKQNHRVTFLAGGYSGAIRQEYIDGIEIIRLGDTNSIYLQIPFYYWTKLRKQNFDLIIDVAHGIPFFTPLFSTIKTILIVHHNHEKLWRTEFSKLISKVGIFLENKVVPLLYKSHFVITLSEASKEELQKIGYKNVSAIAPGIDNNLYKQSSYKTKDPTILYLGRLRKYKRVDLLLNIFPEVKKNIKNIKLIIAGTGQDKARLEYLAREKKITKDVIFKGYVSEAEKVELLQSSWALLFPSMIEGWGLVSLEAAACGTPTIGFNVPGVADAVKSNVSGVLVNSKDEYLKSVIKLMKDSKYRERLSIGAKEWSKRFTGDTAAKSFLSVFNS